MKINFKIRIITLSLLSLALSSCSMFGPDYKKPEVDLGKSSLLGNDKSAKSLQLANLAWWNKFHNAELNNLIESALLHNNNIQIAIGSIIEARGTVQKVNMAWIPTVGIGATDLKGSIFNNNTVINNNSKSQGFSAYNAGFVASYNLNIIQQLKGQDIANANLSIQLANKDAVRMAIISQVTATYFNLVGAKELLLLQQNIVSSLDDKIKIVQVMVDKGIANTSDLDLLEMSQAQASSQIPQMNENISELTNALILLTNSNVPANLGSDANIYNFSNENIIPENLSAKELESRPDIIIAENQLKMSNAQIGLVKGNFFPSINLTGNLGVTGADLPGLLSSTSNFWMTQAKASLPLLNLSLYGQIKEAKGEYYQAYYNYVNVIKSAFIDVNNKLSQNDQINNSYKYIDQMYLSATRLDNATRVSYKLGEKSYADKLDSNINLTNAKASLVEIKIKQLNSLVDVYQSLGGGYNVGNYESSVKFNDSRDI